MNRAAVVIGVNKTTTISGISLSEANAATGETFTVPPPGHKVLDRIRGNLARYFP